MIWGGSHEEDRSARYINDRVHANIQKDGTFSLIPRMRGSITSAAELRKIADLADKYKVPMVVVTGSQRIDLLGIKKSDLPLIWEDLGMRSGQAYTKGVRIVKTCVGTQFCRFGTQDAITVGVQLERRLEDLFTPHKTKLGVVGCPRNCAEATLKDIGRIGQDGGWQVVIGGAAGKGVRKANLLIVLEPAKLLSRSPKYSSSITANTVSISSALTTSSSVSASRRSVAKPSTQPLPSSKGCSSACAGPRPKRPTYGLSATTPAPISARTSALSKPLVRWMVNPPFAILIDSTPLLYKFR